MTPKFLCSSKILEFCGQYWESRTKQEMAVLYQTKGLWPLEHWFQAWPLKFEKNLAKLENPKEGQLREVVA